MLRLLEPKGVDRTTGFRIVREFADLIEPQFIANDSVGTPSTESTSTSPTEVREFADLNKSPSTANDSAGTASSEPASTSPPQGGPGVLES